MTTKNSDKILLISKVLPTDPDQSVLEMMPISLKHVSVLKKALDSQNRNPSLCMDPRPPESSGQSNAIHRRFRSSCRYLARDTLPRTAYGLQVPASQPTGTAANLLAHQLVESSCLLAHSLGARTVLRQIARQTYRRRHHGNHWHHVTGAGMSA